MECIGCGEERATRILRLTYKDGKVGRNTLCFECAVAMAFSEGRNPYVKGAEVEQPSGSITDAVKKARGGEPSVQRLGYA